MRLMERTLKEIAIARRVESKGYLGGRAEAFSGERTLVRGSVLPENGELQVGEAGLSSGKKIRLLVPADTAVQEGDAAYVDEGMFIVKSVSPWTAHLELTCAARA